MQVVTAEGAKVVLMEWIGWIYTGNSDFDSLGERCACTTFSAKMQSEKPINSLMKKILIAALANIIIVPCAMAQSRIINLRSTYNEHKDKYAKSGTQKDRCRHTNLLRSYAQMIMNEGDASNAHEWNTLLQNSGCRGTPLITDPSANNSSTKSNPNIPSNPQSIMSIGASCISMREILEINTKTEAVFKKCQGGGYLSIKVSH